MDDKGRENLGSSGAAHTCVNISSEGQLTANIPQSPHKSVEFFINLELVRPPE